MLLVEPRSSRSPGRGRPIRGVASLALLLGLLAAPTLFAQPIGTTTDPIPYPTSDDAAIVSWLHERVEAIGDVRKVTSSDLGRVFRELDSARFGAEHFLATYPESPHRAEVLRILTRLLFIDRDRHFALADHKNVMEWGEKLGPAEKQIVIDDYRQKILAHLEEGLALASDGKTRSGLLETFGEVMLRAQRYSDGARSFLDAIRADPGRADLDEAYIKLAEAYILAGDYASAEPVALEALMRFPRSNLWPHYFWYLHKVLRHQGKIEAALAAWTQVLPRLEAGAKGLPIIAAGGYVVPEQYRTDYQRYLDRSEFYRGFFEYALGNIEVAQKALQGFSDHFREKQMDGEDLGMDLITYLDFQSDPMDQRMALLQGHELPSIEGLLHWLSEPTETARRKPARIRVFASASRASNRQRGMFELLRELGLEYRDRLQIEWVSFAMREGEILTKEERAMREFLDHLGVAEWTVGIDIGASNVHPSHGTEAANVVMYVTDGEGKLAWMLIDPMDWDEGLIRRVIERLHGGD